MLQIQNLNERYKIEAINDVMKMYKKEHIIQIIRALLPTRFDREMY